MEKEKLLKKICKKELHDVWEWGAREGKSIAEKTMNPEAADFFRRTKQSLLRHLTDKLRDGGVLPL